jgi:hypothetical protein
MMTNTPSERCKRHVVFSYKEFQLHKRKRIFQQTSATP